MKTRNTHRHILTTTVSALLGLTLFGTTSQAASLTWDANAAGASQTDGAGAWLGANQWWNGSANTTWTSGDDAIFGNGGGGGAVSLASPTTLNSLSFNAFTGTYTLGTAGQSMTLSSGLTMNTGAGVAALASPIILGGSQSWTNNAPAGVVRAVGLNTLDIGAFDLTVGGSGAINMAPSTGNQFTISGTGGIIKNGSGLLTLGGASSPTHSFSGAVTLNGGGILVANPGLGTGNGNLTINDGYLELYFGNPFTRTLGAGSGNIQILGGTSGFSGAGATSSTVTIGTAGSALTWGSSFFSPNVFLLGSATANLNGKLTLANGIDLNGSDRAITSLQVTDGAATSGVTVSGVISNSAGTAGFTKSGPGNLILTNTNTYNGATTISGGFLTAASSAALGDGSATNTLVLNGGTLRASGAIASGAARNVTLSSNGIVDTNGFSVSIAGAVSGGGTLTKSGSGTLTLSGANNYTGVTTVNAGTLLFSSPASLYNGNSGSWTPANINVKAGAVLALAVDSAGAAGFDNSSLTTLIGNLSVAGSAASGLQARSGIGLDTTNATGATFTAPFPISNSSGAFGGAIGLVKLGTGTLVLNQANSYTGPTFVGGGTLQIGSGGAAGSLSPASGIHLGTGAVLAVNQSDAVTQGVDFGQSVITGTGGFLQAGSGTTTLNILNTFSGTTTASAGVLNLAHGRALQNSALVTTGAGAITLTGVSALTLGGLSGASGDVGSIVTSGYESVSALVLNPLAGSVTYGGIVSDGAAGMSLTKTGGGTQVLQGASTYTGATTVNAGTLELSGAGSLIHTSGIAISGGTLTLANASPESGSGRLGDAKVLTANSGTLLYSNTSGANVYAETIGSVALESGQFNVVESINQTVAGNQTLTLSGLTRPGTANSSVVTFSAATTAPNGTKNIIAVAGAAQTSAGQIIGPWATTGTAAGTQTDYAVFNAAGQVVPAALSTTAESGWTTPGNAYSLNTGSAVTLSGTRTVGALQFYGATSTLNTATGANLETGGLLFSGANQKTVASTGTGVLTTPSGGGMLFITTGNSAITHVVSAAIADNGGAVTVVKSGLGALTLSGTNTFTGSLIVNAGTVNAATAANIGGTAPVIFNGSATFNTGSVTYNRGLIINNGAIVSIGNSNPVFTGNVTGTGGIAVTTGFGSQAVLSGTGNTFEGPILIGLNSGTTGQAYRVAVASLADSATASGRIAFLASSVTHANGSVFEYTGTTPLIINNRQFELSSATASPVLGHQIRSSGSGTITINTDLVVTTGAAQTLSLVGANSGANTFAGKINDGPNAARISLNKGDAGTWILAGANNYSGPTTIAAGVLEIGGSGSLGAGDYSGNISISNTSGGTLRFNTTEDQILSGVVSGSGALFKNNTGVLTLTAVSPYTGATTVADGSLVVSGVLSGSAVAVQGAGTLMGTGGISGAVTVQSGGTLAPGLGIESLATGVLTMNAGATLAYEFNSDAVPGLAGDLVAITGGLNLDLGNTTALTFTNLGTGAWSPGEKLTMLSYSGAWNGGLFDFGGVVADDSTIVAGGTQWVFDYNDVSGGTNFAGDLTGSSYVTLTAVPEPGTGMVLLAGVGALVAGRRRRAATSSFGRA